MVFDVAPTSINASNTAITPGPGPVKFSPAGATSVVVTRTATAAATPLDCTNAWVTFLTAPGA